MKIKYLPIFILTACAIVVLSLAVPSQDHLPAVGIIPVAHDDKVFFVGFHHDWVVYHAAENCWYVEIPNGGEYPVITDFEALRDYNPPPK